MNEIHPRSAAPPPSAPAAPSEPAEPGADPEAADASGEAHPVLLFDGVCNLCNAAVQQVIDRDPEARFRFASLQSEAGRRLLARAGAPKSMPDSVVLIDQNGVHTRSDAAIRTAGKLGLPWSLLSIARLVPRPLRDLVYDGIARNRYRWFGRQTVCRMPTPDLRARFLDADEPVPTSPPAVAAATSSAASTPAAGADRGTAGRGVGLATLPARLLFLYPILFMLPFPLSLAVQLVSFAGLDGPRAQAVTGWLIGLHGQVTQPIVAWMGRWMTGQQVSLTFTGSGDGLFAYLDVLLDASLAVLLALAWWAWRRSTPISRTAIDVGRTLLRYYLAWIMLSYGFAKLFPLQFPAPGPDRLLQPYGDSSPMGLLWTFMGASAGYQMFGGAGEVLAGLLLLWRRTTLLGALVATTVMTNVFALNLFYDVPVKLYSLHYLLFALVLTVPDLPRLLGVLLANVPVAQRDLEPPWRGSRRIRRGLAVAKAVLVVALLVMNIVPSLESMRTTGRWADPHPLDGIYRVERFVWGNPDTGAVPASAEAATPEGSADGETTVAAGGAPAASSGSSPPDAEARWLRVGLNPPYIGTVQRVDGTAIRMRLQVDLEASTLALFDRGLREPPDEPMRLERPEDGVLVLDGLFQGTPIVVTLRRQTTESLLTSRGFHWINEYPFNR